MAYDASVLTRHALSQAYPAMSADDFDALMADIQRNGLREAVVTFEGQILDGWHRHNACIMSGVPAMYVEFDEGDPVEFVRSKNRHRRHLTASQIAASEIKLHEWRPRGGDQSAPGALCSSTDAQIARIAHVSERTVEQAKAAERAGLGDAVRDGKVSAKVAAEIAKAPPKIQAQARRAIEEGEKPVLPKPAKVVPVGADALRGEMDEMRERLSEMASQLEETVEENASLNRVFAADDKVVAALAEAKRYREQVRILEGRVTGLMNEKNEAIRAAKSWQRKAEKVGQGIPK